MTHGVRNASRAALVPAAALLVGLVAFVVWLLDGRRDADVTIAPIAHDADGRRIATEGSPADQDRLLIEPVEVDEPAAVLPAGAPAARSDELGSSSAKGAKETFADEAAYLDRKVIRFTEADAYNPRHPVLTLAQLERFKSLLDQLANELETSKAERDAIQSAVFRRKVEQKQYERFVPGTRYRRERSLAVGLDFASIGGEARRVVVRIEPGDSPEFEAALKKSRSAKSRADQRVVAFFRDLASGAETPAVDR